METYKSYVDGKWMHFPIGDDPPFEDDIFHDVIYLKRIGGTLWLEVEGSSLVVKTFEQKCDMMGRANFVSKEVAFFHREGALKGALTKPKPWTLQMPIDRHLHCDARKYISKVIHLLSAEFRKEMDEWERIISNQKYQRFVDCE